MSDLHQLPLRGHDLPERAPQVPERQKAKVFKDGDAWAWYHACGNSHRSWTWEGALERAQSHLHWCCR